MTTKAAALAIVFLSLFSMSAIAGAGPGYRVDKEDDQPPPNRNYVLHEWGTFTTIAGADGRPVEWQPFTGTNTELPPFVQLASALQSGHLDTRATVRMETPVLYFYAKEPLKVNVRVGFPGGTITEWFPRAVEHQGGIAWNTVRIVPGAPETAFPGVTRHSEYFAARATDATPIIVGNESEKFLFYRGVGSPEIRETVKLAADGVLVTDGFAGDVIAFERRGKRVGFRVGRGELARPEVSGTSLRDVEAAMKSALVERGLYPKEADAMLATWRPTWFEEGLRVFSFVERTKIDAMLPLTVNPKPAETVRVIVGRTEVITPEVEAAVAKSGDASAYGRFAEPILRRVCATRQLAACIR